MHTPDTCLTPSITHDKHGASYSAGGVPAKEIVTLFILGVAGSGDHLVALHLAFTGGAAFALVPVIAQARAVDLDAAHAALGVGLGAGGGTTCKHYHGDYYDKPVHSDPY